MNHDTKAPKYSLIRWALLLLATFGSPIGFALEAPQPPIPVFLQNQPAQPQWFHLSPSYRVDYSNFQLKQF